MSQTQGAAGSEFELLLEIGMDIDVFASNWAYCDRLSSYVARMVSHNRTDSLLYSNLFSSALNELLETVYRAHGESGGFVCRVLRLGDRDRIELTVPCDTADIEFYGEAMKRLERSDVADQYRSALFSQGPLDPDIGLFELAVDYEAALRVETKDKNTIRLIADLALEDTKVDG